MSLRTAFTSAVKHRGGISDLCALVVVLYAESTGAWGQSLGGWVVKLHKGHGKNFFLNFKECRDD